MMQDHKRGCQGREYTCTCGYDERMEKLLNELAKCVEAALNMVDGNGFPPNWDLLRATLKSARQP